MSKFDKVIGYEDIKAEGRLCEMANELFDMANVSKKDTNLPYDIWIDSEGKNRNTKQNYPQLKVDYNGDKIPVSISEDPDILVKKKIPEFSRIKSWIKKYSVVLLQHWNKEITDKEALNQLGE